MTAIRLVDSARNTISSYRCEEQFPTKKSASWPALEQTTVRNWYSALYRLIAQIWTVVSKTWTQSWYHWNIWVLEIVNVAKNLPAEQ